MIVRPSGGLGGSKHHNFGCHVSLAALVRTHNLCLESQVVTPLGKHLQQHKISVESAVRIVFQPQAIFRVRPITRCSASLAGGRTFPDALLLYGSNANRAQEAELRAV